MRRAILLTLALTLSWLGQPIPAQRPSGTASASDLVGTWTLTTLERGPSGESIRVPNPRGMLVFDVPLLTDETITADVVAGPGTRL